MTPNFGAFGADEGLEPSTPCITNVRRWVQDRAVAGNFKFSGPPKRGPACKVVRDRAAAKVHDLAVLDGGIGGRAGPFGSKS